MQPSHPDSLISLYQVINCYTVCTHSISIWFTFSCTYIYLQFLFFFFFHRIFIMEIWILFQYNHCFISSGNLMKCVSFYRFPDSFVKKLFFRKIYIFFFIFCWMCVNLLAKSERDLFQKRKKKKKKPNPGHQSILSA